MIQLVNVLRFRKSLLKRTYNKSWQLIKKDILKKRQYNINRWL